MDLEPAINRGIRLGGFLAIWPPLEVLGNLVIVDLDKVNIVII